MPRAVERARETDHAPVFAVAVADHREGNEVGGLGPPGVPDDIARQPKMLVAAPFGKVAVDLLDQRGVDPGIGAVVREAGEQKQLLRRRDPIGVARRAVPAREAGARNGIAPARGRRFGFAVKRLLQDRDRPPRAVNEALRKFAAGFGTRRVDPRALRDGPRNGGGIVVGGEAVGAEMSGTADTRVDARQRQLMGVHIGDDRRLPRRFLGTEPDGETSFRKVEGKGLGRPRA